MGFDLSSIPSNSRIINATWEIYAYDWLGWRWCAPSPQVIHETGDFNEYTLTWMTAHYLYPWGIEIDRFDSCNRAGCPPDHIGDCAGWGSGNKYIQVNVTRSVANHTESDQVLNLLWETGFGRVTFDFSSREGTYPPRLVVYYESLIVEEVKTSIVAPSDYYMEENNTVVLTANVTGTGFNVTYDDSGGSDVYLTFNNTTEQISIPFLRFYNLTTGIYNFTFDIFPKQTYWDGFTQTVEKPDATVDTYSYYLPNITIGYREPLYNFSVEYPIVMYITENNTVRHRATPNPAYQYAKANVTVRYANQESTVFFYDDVDQLTPIEVTPPYEKTYYDTYNTTNSYFIVTPLTENYTGYTVDAESDNPLQNLTEEFNKSEEFPPSDPDYVEVRYRYDPVVYPLEDKTLILQFHHFTGNWEEARGSCEYNQTSNVTTCYEPTVNLTINCRTCGENSTYQVVQYWMNETDCDWFNETILGLEYWSYPITMILQDRDVCNNSAIVPDDLDFNYTGSLKALENRNKFVFFNKSKSGQKGLYGVFSDALGLKAEFNTEQNKTKIKDRDNVNQHDDTDTYVADFTIEDSKVTFYIANKKAQTVWVDKVLIPNTLAWNTFNRIDALYTTHGKKTIDVVATFDEGTDTVTVVPVEANGKIPLEPATGSNILIIDGGVRFVGASGIMIGVLVPIMLVLTFIMFAWQRFGEITFDTKDPFKIVVVAIGIMVLFVVVVYMMQYFAVALMGLV